MVHLPPNYTDIDAYAQDVISFLHEPLSIQITGGIHVNDAFIHSAWSKLPQEWTSFWSSLPSAQDAQKDLINSLHSDPDARKHDLPNRPESLSLWLSRIRNLSLDRAQLALSTSIPAVKIPDPIATRMNTKKQSEVHAGARYIAHVCKTNSITHVIDMGSGQGHLSLTLASSCDLRVLAVDGSAKQLAGSRLGAAALGLAEGRQITHLERYVTVDSTLERDIKDWARGERCLLTGLHACGSLSEHMLRLFSSCPKITRLAVVGCCYNHIVPLSPSTPQGFPISAFMRDRALQLSASALVTGCQAPTNWIHKSDSSFSKKFFYRAVLEKLLHDKILDTTTTRQVWGIRTSDLKDFSAYTSRALSTLNLQNEITEEEIRAYEQKFRGREHETAILWTLSVLLCRVVESVVVLDRSFFLREHGARDVDVLPIFDYTVSPRNLMVVARK